MAGRRRMVFAFAAVAGFFGRDGIAANAAEMATSLVAVFVAVFVLSLVISVIRAPAAGFPKVGPGPVRSGYPETPVSHEALYGSR